MAIKVRCVIDKFKLMKKYLNYIIVISIYGIRKIV